MAFGLSSMALSQSAIGLVVTLLLMENGRALDAKAPLIGTGRDGLVEGLNSLRGLPARQQGPSLQAKCLRVVWAEFEGAVAVVENGVPSRLFFVVSGNEQMSLRIL